MLCLLKLLNFVISQNFYRKLVTSQENDRATKLVSLTNFIWNAQTKKGKKCYFIKNVS